MKKQKPVSEKTRAMLDMMEQDAEAAPAGDKLDRIRRYVSELRDAELEKLRLEEDLRTQNKLINDLLWSRIPQVMDEGMTSSFTLAADGNKPPYTVEIYDDYKANIPGERAEEAYEFLRKRNAGDLIKTEYRISFGLGEAKASERFERSLEKAGIAFETKRGVPWNTLTAWFRDEYRKRPLPNRAMEMLGASVKRVARVVKAKKEKK